MSVCFEWQCVLCAYTCVYCRVEYEWMNHFVSPYFHSACFSFTSQWSWRRHDSLFLSFPLPEFVFVLSALSIPYLCHSPGHARGDSCGTIMCTIANVRKKGHNERSKSSLVKLNEPNFTVLWDIIRFVSAIWSLNSAHTEWICSVVFKVSHWWLILQMSVMLEEHPQASFPSHFKVNKTYTCIVDECGN